LFAKLIITLAVCVLTVSSFVRCCVANKAAVSGFDMSVCMNALLTQFVFQLL